MTCVGSRPSSLRLPSTPAVGERDARDLRKQRERTLRPQYQSVITHGLHLVVSSVWFRRVVRSPCGPVGVPRHTGRISSRPLSSLRPAEAARARHATDRGVTHTLAERVVRASRYNLKRRRMGAPAIGDAGRREEDDGCHSLTAIQPLPDRSEGTRPTLNSLIANMYPSPCL